MLLAVENLGSDNLKSSMVIPPPTVLDRVLKDLLLEGTLFFQFTKHFDVLYLQEYVACFIYFSLCAYIKSLMFPAVA